MNSDETKPMIFTRKKSKTTTTGRTFTVSTLPAHLQDEVLLRAFIGKLKGEKP